MGEVPLSSNAGVPRIAGVLFRPGSLSHPLPSEEVTT